MNTAWLKENWWKVLLIAGVIALAVTLFLLSSTIAKKAESNPIVTPQDGEQKNPIATITLESGEEIRIELYPDKAPNTVYSFISLANSGFYDGVIFHRIINDFIIQGGDPKGTGRGGPGYTIPGEFKVNKFEQNDLSHTPGVISMARQELYYNSAGSQFFIVVGKADFLDRKYAAFGKTADQESLDVCMKLAEQETGKGDRPLEPPVMKTVRVETFGIQYPEPEKLSVSK